MHGNFTLTFEHVHRYPDGVPGDNADLRRLEMMMSSISQDVADLMAAVQEFKTQEAAEDQEAVDLRASVAEKVAKIAELQAQIADLQQRFAVEVPTDEERANLRAALDEVRGLINTLPTPPPPVEGQPVVE